MKAEPKFYQLSDRPTQEEVKQHEFVSSLDSRFGDRRLMGAKTGEFRAPRAGEWFLSGAIPEGYRAGNNLSGKYHILRLAVVRKRVIWEEEE